tara:strand:- start:69 stop:452 length:384 start_codon:yes stop_codon:yes gene_type:complete
MKKIFLYILIGLLWCNISFSEIINIDCKIDFGDGTSIDKSWKLDSKKSNYWNKFSENSITWVEVVLPENNDDNKYSYSYFRVDRTNGSLVVEFSVGVNKLLKKNHKKQEIFAKLFGKCKKGSGTKIF